MLSKEEKEWLKEQLVKYNIKEEKSDEIFEEFDDFFENEIDHSKSEQNDEQFEQNKLNQLIFEIKNLKEQINLINIQKESESEKILDFQKEVLDSFKIAFSELETLKDYHQNNSLKLEVLKTI